MPKPKKDNHPISFRIDSELYNRFNAFCLDAGQTKTTAMERALTMYMEDYEEKQRKILNK